MCIVTVEKWGGARGHLLVSLYDASLLAVQLLRSVAILTLALPVERRIT